MSSVHALAYQEAHEAFQRRDIARALKAAVVLLEQDAPDRETVFLTVSILLAAGKPQEVLTQLDQHAPIVGKDGRALVLKAQAHFALAEFGAGDAIIDQLRDYEGDDSYVCDGVGSLIFERQKSADALKYYRRAAALAPEDPAFKYNLAIALQAFGDLSEAEDTFDDVVRLSPDDGQAWLHRSRLRKQTPDKNHVQALRRALLKLDPQDSRRVPLGFALAKELEDIGQFDQSFVILKESATLRRSKMRYDPVRDRQMLAHIEKHFSKEVMAGIPSGAASDAPIFVLGMPRSGTTLVERTLLSSGQIVSIGEASGFALELMRLVAAEKGARPPSGEALVKASCSVNFDVLGRRYLNGVKVALGRTERFIDKQPLNFLYCGLIVKALPNARIVSVVRDPMDSCLAIFKTLFKDAYPFSYDLQELAAYYASYRRLMAHWKSVLAQRIYTVSYENLVTNPRSVLQELYEFCGLKWSEHALASQDVAGLSTTASLAQIRQPIYRSSVGSWRRYEARLADINAFFRAEGIYRDS